MIWLVPTFVNAAEPLHGPICSLTYWQLPPEENQSSASATQNRARAVNERRIAIDIPIPVNLNIAMPFALLRHQDRTLKSSSDFSQTQNLTFGFLHHPAEGEPSWRVEVSRLGPWHHALPTVKMRAIGSLVKPFPQLKLRPSDSLFSWYGVSIFARAKHQTLIVPEVSWQRTGQDGLQIDIHAPKHFYLGFRSQYFGVLLGAEQDIKTEELAALTNRSIDASDTTGFKEFELERSMRLKISSYPQDQMQLSLSAIKLLTDANHRPPIGLELALQWIPNS